MRRGGGQISITSAENEYNYGPDIWCMYEKGYRASYTSRWE
jgi:hypothetical protein